MKRIFPLIASLAVSLAVLFSAIAANAETSIDREPEKAVATDAAAAMSSGEVKKVDKDAGKITIKHGPLNNLGMPGMTMVFRVADSAMLDQVKVGDKVAFVAEKKNGFLTVTKMTVVK